MEKETLIEKKKDQAQAMAQVMTHAKPADPEVIDPLAFHESLLRAAELELKITEASISACILQFGKKLCRSDLSLSADLLMKTAVPTSVLPRRLCNLSAVASQVDICQQELLYQAIGTL